MSDPIAAYLESVEPERRALIEHYYELARAVVPDAVPDRKYAMACYSLRGKGLVAVLATKAGLSIVPFSGSLTGQVAGDFAVSEGGGSLYCTPARPLPDEAFTTLVRLRQGQILAG